MQLNTEKLKGYEQLKVARIVAGYTQKSLAKKLGVTTGAVNQWETGRAAPKIEKLKPLADALGVSVDDLVLAIMQKAG